MMKVKKEQDSHEFSMLWIKIRIGLKDYDLHFLFRNLYALFCLFIEDI